MLVFNFNYILRLHQIVGCFEVEVGQGLKDEDEGKDKKNEALSAVLPNR